MQPHYIYQSLYIFIYNLFFFLVLFYYTLHETLFNTTYNSNRYVIVRNFYTTNWPCQHLVSLFDELRTRCGTRVSYSLRAIVESIMINRFWLLYIYSNFKLLRDDDVYFYARSFLTGPLCISETEKKISRLFSDMNKSTI